MTPSKNRRSARSSSGKDGQYIETPIENDASSAPVSVPASEVSSVPPLSQEQEAAASRAAPPSYASRERVENYEDQQPRSRGYRQRPPAEPEYDRTGDILRYARQQRGETLEAIADYLRIRPTYLAALEACRYEDLPADAYVIGFLRTYATYLGFEGKTAIDHYRREMAGRRRKPQLAMPQPVAESRAPTVAILIAAVTAALLVYGLWYVFSTSDRAAVSLPPPMPEAPIEDQLSPPDGNNPAAPAPQTNGDGQQPSSATPDNNAAPAAAPADSSQATPPVDGKAPVAAQPSAPTAPNVPNNAAPPQPVPAPVTAPSVSNKAPPSSAAMPQPVSTSTQQPAAPTVAQQPETSKKGEGRVSMKATKECWIQVSDSHGKVWVDKTLRPGETYQVPADKKDLKLTIGNVKGLDIMVDGMLLKPLSNDGRVLRGVALDADSLKARAGVASSEEPSSDANND